MSEINVTPFVDVMLVLLIVFMLGAQLVSAGYNVDLPDAQSNAVSAPTEESIVITVDSAGAVYLGADRVDPLDLPARLATLNLNPAEDIIYIQGDRVADYGPVFEVGDLLTVSGYRRFVYMGKPVPRGDEQ